MTTANALDLSRGGPFFAALLLIALFAFWPSYIALGPRGSNGYAHLHATTSILWMLLLIAQPLAIRWRRMDLHRLLGRTSYVLGPVVVLGFILLANSRIRSISSEHYHFQSYVLYLQISLAVVFALCYGLAIAWRHRTAWHARFMTCTALTLIDPILARLIFMVDQNIVFGAQWISFGITNMLLISLIVLERHNKSGRGVFPAMLGVFLVAQIPALAGWWRGDLWQGFATWFAGLPLT